MLTKQDLEKRMRDRLESLWDEHGRISLGDLIRALNELAGELDLEQPELVKAPE